MLWVEVISFGYIKVGYKLFGGFCQEEVFVEGNFVVVFFVGFLFEVVDHGNLGRVVLEQKLGRDRWYETARK